MAKGVKKQRTFEDHTWNTTSTCGDHFVGKGANDRLDIPYSTLLGRFKPHLSKRNELNKTGALKSLKVMGKTLTKNWSMEKVVLVSVCRM